jgi:hypothetical protein
VLSFQKLAPNARKRFLDWRIDDFIVVLVIVKPFQPEFFVHPAIQ